MNKSSDLGKNSSITNVGNFAEVNLGVRHFSSSASASSNTDPNPSNCQVPHHDITHTGDYNTTNFNTDFVHDGVLYPLDKSPQTRMTMSTITTGMANLTNTHSVLPKDYGFEHMKRAMELQALKKSLDQASRAESQPTSPL